MTFDYLYEMLRRHAKSKGSVNGQVWHEADIDGYHLYMSDTSFGDGPIFRINGSGKHNGWQRSHPDAGWEPYTRDTSEADAEFALELASRAVWEYRLEKLDPLAQDATT